MTDGRWGFLSSCLSFLGGSLKVASIFFFVCFCFFNVLKVCQAVVSSIGVICMFVGIISWFPGHVG